MKKTLSALALVLLRVPAAHATDIQEALANCSAMEDGTKRLACFDQLAKDFQETVDTEGSENKTDHSTSPSK